MSLEDDDWLERPDHPLLNNVILTTVFKTLRKRDLKACRLVCKAWNVSTIPYTRDAFSVTLYGMPPTYDEQSTGTIGNFMQVFRSNELGIPFARFQLGSFCATEGIGQEFLQLCGNVINEIDFDEDDYIIEELSELLKSTPKLEKFEMPTNLRSRSGDVVKLFPGPEDGIFLSIPKLTCLKALYIYFDNREKRNRFCPTFLEEFFTAAENISIVQILDSISINEEREAVNRGSSIEVLSLIEKLGRESSIQELQLLHDRSDDSEYFELLRKMTMKPDGLKLKKFSYEPGSFNQKTHKLCQLVSLFKDTLEVLDILGNNSVCFTEFQKMSHLSRLFIQLSHNFSSKFVNLNEIFPVLKVLELFRDNCVLNSHEPQLEEFFPESAPCQHLEAFYSNIVFKITTFNQMLTVFPKLTKLRINLHKDDGAVIIRQICSEMTQLKRLHLSGTLQSMDSVDSVLTGISNDALQEIRDAVDNLENMPTEFERREEIMNLKSQYSHLPSIGNLTNLRSLYLDVKGTVDSERDVKGLTDLTGYLGFYSMKHLRKLEVKSCEMTKTCCEILTKDLGLHSWTFERMFWPTGQDKNIIPSEEN